MEQTESIETAKMKMKTGRRYKKDVFLFLVHTLTKVKLFWTTEREKRREGRERGKRTRAKSFWKIESCATFEVEGREEDLGGSGSAS